MTERFIRVDIFKHDLNRKRAGVAWGLVAGGEGDAYMTKLIYTRSRMVHDIWRACATGMGLGLMDNEIATIVDADETNTPGKAWAQLAHYRLDPEAFVKED